MVSVMVSPSLIANEGVDGPAHQVAVLVRPRRFRGAEQHASQPPRALVVAAEPALWGDAVTGAQAHAVLHVHAAVEHEHQPRAVDPDLLLGVIRVVAALALGDPGNDPDHTEKQIGINGPGLMIPICFSV